MIAVVVVIALAFVILEVFRGTVMTPTSADQIRRVLMSRSKVAIGEPLRIGSASFDPFGRFEARDVRLGEGRDEIFRASSARARWSLLRLILHPRNPAGALTALILEQPVIRVERDANGKWNLQRLIRKPMKKPPAYPAMTIGVRNGTVRLTDLWKDAPVRRASYAIDSGLVTLAPQRSVDVNVRLRGPGVPDGARIRATSGDGYRWQLSFDTDRVDATLANAWLRKREFALRGGLGRVRVRVGLRPGGPVAVVGVAKLDGLSVEWKKGGLRIDNLSGNVGFAGRRVAFDGVTASVAGGEISLRGGVRLDGRYPVSAAAVLRGVDLSAFRGYVPEKQRKWAPQGRLDADVYVLGDVSHPDVIVDSAVKDGNIGGRRFDRVELRARLSGRRLFVDSARVIAGRGVADARGVVEFSDKWNPSRADLVADAAGWPLETIAAESGLKLKQMISGEVGARIVAYLRKEGETPTIFGELRGEAIRVGRLAPMQWIAGFHTEDKKIVIENVAGRGGEQSLAGEGTIGADGSLDMTLETATGNAGEILSALAPTKFAATGTVSLKGKLAGTIQNPVFEGDVSADNVRVSDMNWVGVAGHLRYDGVAISFRGFRMDAPGRIDYADADIYLKEKRFVLDLRTGDVPVTAAVAFLQEVIHVHFPDISDLGGTAAGRYHIEGPFRSPRVEGYLTLHRVTLYGERVDDAVVGLTYDKFITLRDGLAHIGRGALRFSGHLRYKALSLSFSSPALWLDDLHIASKYKFGGAASLNGVLAGTWRAPEIRVSFSSKSIRLRSEAFEVQHGTMRLHDGVFTIDSTQFTRGDEHYLLQGGYDLASSSLDLTVLLKMARLETLAAFLPFSLPEESSGVLDGQLKIVGIAGEVGGSLSVNSKQLTFGAYPLTDFTLEGDYLGSRFSVRQFSASNEQSEFSAGGELDFANQSRSLLNLQATNVDLERLASMKVLPLSVKGHADVNVQVVSENGVQKMTGSIESGGLSVMGVAFDRARGQFEYGRDLLTVQNFQFLRGSDRLTVSADVPMSRGRITTMRIAPRTGGFALSVLNDALAPYGVKLGGRLVMNDMIVSGPPNDLIFGGTMEVEDGTLEDARLDRPVTDISGKIVFSENAGAIQSLTGKISGRVVSVTGGVEFSDKGLKNVQIDLLDITALPIGIRNLYAGLADFEGIELKGRPGRFILTGAPGRSPRITVHDGIFTLPGTKSASVGAGSALEFTDREITIVAGKGLVLRTQGNNVRLTPRGSLQLSGTFDRPQIKGTLTSNTGSVRYFNIAFNLEDQAIIGFFSPEGIGLIPILYARASTRREGSDITITISGPMISIDEIPAYRRICGEGASIYATPGSQETVSMPNVAVGGEMSVPICPRVQMQGVAADGTALGDQTILQKLTQTEGVIAGTQNMSAMFQNELYTTLSGAFAPFVERGVNLQNFQINLDPNKDLYIQLEKYLNDRISVRYDRLFSEIEKQNLDLRYRFRKRSYILVGIDQDNKSHFDLEYQIPF